MSEVRFIQIRDTGGTDDEHAILTNPMPPFDGDVESALSIAKKLEAVVDASSIAVGLAAPQIGIRARVAVAKLGDEVVHLIDPVILRTSGKKERKRESCLSVWGLAGEVERRDKVLVRYLDPNEGYVERQFRSYFSRIVQHEIDHLEGVIYLDRLSGEPFETELFGGSQPVVFLEE